MCSVVYWSIFNICENVQFVLSRSLWVLRFKYCVLNVAFFTLSLFWSSRLCKFVFFCLNGQGGSVSSTFSFFRTRVVLDQCDWNCFILCFWSFRRWFSDLRIFFSSFCMVKRLVFLQVEYVEECYVERRRFQLCAKKMKFVYQTKIETRIKVLLRLRLKNNLTHAGTWPAGLHSATQEVFERRIPPKSVAQFQSFLKRLKAEKTMIKSKSFLWSDIMWPTGRNAMLELKATNVHSTSLNHVLLIWAFTFRYGSQQTHTQLRASNFYTYKLMATAMVLGRYLVC